MKTMCDAFLEGPQAQSEKWRRARIEHKCYACREKILPGQRYHYYSGIWDGRPEAYKHCTRCWTMLDALFERSSEPVDLRLNCGEVWENPPPEVAELAFALPGDFNKR